MTTATGGGAGCATGAGATGATGLGVLELQAAISDDIATNISELRVIMVALLTERTVLSASRRSVAQLP